MLKLGIVGCGKVTTTFHMKAIRDISDISVVALSDINKDRMAEVQRICSADRCYLDYEQMLQDPEVAAVSICTPPQTHFEMTLQAVMKGKHVLCEKPVAQTQSQCKELDSLAKKMGVVVLPVHNFLFTPSLVLAHSLISDGRIGSMKSTEIEISSSLRLYRPRTDFRMRNQFGVVDDLLPHALSTSCWLGGPVQTIRKARAWGQRSSVFDNASLSFLLRDNVRLQVELSWTKLLPAFRVSTVGGRGRLELDLMRSPNTCKLWTNGTRSTLGSQGLLRDHAWMLRVKHPAFRNQYVHFMNVIAGWEQPVMGLKEEATIIEATEGVRSLLSMSALSEGSSAK